MRRLVGRPSCDGGSSMKRFGSVVLLVATLVVFWAASPTVALAVGGATRAKQDAWLATAAGRYMNPDGWYGYQCVDVADDYCIALWGDWRGTLGAGNAGWGLFNGASSTYFDKFLNNPDPNWIPVRGDIVFWTGHVAVVDASDVGGMWVMEQNYALPDGTVPCRRHWTNYAGVIAWLRPKLDPTPPPPPTPTPTPTPSLKPVYRFYNLKVGVHFYTASESEKNNVINTLGNVYRFEGPSYSINLSNPNNTLPVYRFFNTRAGVHFYTASAAERDNVINTLGGVYRFEGPSYNVSSTSANAFPVYRFYNLKQGVHFYTSSEAEKNNVINTLGGVYRFEGISYYVGK